jgi:glycosyltransferase involved in cell wall biosynthesis
MRIAIDMQGAQTESRFRGIGRYTLSLALAMARNRGSHDIFLVLNGMFAETIEPIRAAFDGILPQSNIRVWYGPSSAQTSGNVMAWQHKASVNIREAFIASLRPDVLHVTSLFEGYADGAITSIGSVDSMIPTAVTLYDLIPLLNADTYLKPRPNYRQYYLRQIDFLKRANAWLAISESSANEGRRALQLPWGAVVNISAACDAVFSPQPIQEDRKRMLFSRLRVTRPFVLYSGGADPRKNLPRLIRAYASLPTMVRELHQLVLVGKIHESLVYELHQTARSAHLGEQDMLVTGYVSDEDLAMLYSTCATFVLPSIHEGFGLPALEAMACGAAVIGSSSTSLPEVIGRQDALFDPYDEAAMSALLEKVLSDKVFHSDLAAHGLRQAQLFSWDKTAQLALGALESMYAATPSKTSKLGYQNLLPELIRSIASCLPTRITEAELLELALCTSSVRKDESAKQLLIDVSELVHYDAKSGVQRVTRSILMELLESPPIGYAVEPIYAEVGSPGYRYASQFKARCMGLPVDTFDEPISHFPGDILLMLDLQHHVVRSQQYYLQSLRRDGVAIHFVVYDLLAVSMPHVFPAGMEIAHIAWLKVLTQFDGAVCISATVANELAAWHATYGPPRLRPFNIQWFHLGADIKNSSPALGLPEDAAQVLEWLSLRPSFLMVGTLEPRKGHTLALEAFEVLWAQGVEVNLVIVGKCGWMVEQLASRLRNHVERHSRLLWLESASDEYLEMLYASSSCLIAASEGEGFGLPLIEAAKHQLPVIARDIAVFREVAGEHAFFFNDRSTGDLVKAVRDWLQLFALDQHPGSAGMRWQSWKDSARQLLACIIPDSH